MHHLSLQDPQSPLLPSSAHLLLAWTQSRTMAQRCGRMASANSGILLAILHPSTISFSVIIPLVSVRSNGQVLALYPMLQASTPCVVPGALAPKIPGSVDPFADGDGISSNYILSTTTALILLANYCFSLMTTPLTNVVSVASLTNGPIPTDAPLRTLAQSDVSSTTIYADVIQVQWQSTDQKIIALMDQQSASSSTTLSTLTTSSSIASSTTFSTFGSAPADSTNNPPETAANTGLSPSAKGGIAAGVIIAVILIIAAAASYYYFFLKRRKQQRSTKPHDSMASENQQELSMAYLPTSPVEVGPPLRPPTQELPGSTADEELDGGRKPSVFEKGGSDPVDKS